MSQFGPRRAVGSRRRQELVPFAFHLASAVTAGECVGRAVHRDLNADPTPGKWHDEIRRLSCFRLLVRAQSERRKTMSKVWRSLLFWTSRVIVRPLNPISDPNAIEWDIMCRHRARRRAQGRKRALANGVKFGRKRKLSDYQRTEAVKRRDAGETLAAIAKSYGVDLSMISRL